jgi:hypothetical protein
MNIITEWFKKRQLHKAEEQIAKIKALMEQTSKYQTAGKPGNIPYSMAENIIEWRGEIAMLTVRISRLQKELGTQK